MRVLLRLRSLQEDNLVLMELSDPALAQIADDLRDYGYGERNTHERSSGACSLVECYSHFDFVTRVRVNLRLRAIDESGLELDTWSVDALRNCLAIDLKLAI